MEPLDVFDKEYERAYWLKHEPWRIEKIVPIEWLRQNFSRFVYEQNFILANAFPYQWMDGPHSCGIYFLISGGKIIYVGRSNYIRTRLRQHLDTAVEFTHYWCFDGVPSIFLDDVESYYIHSLRPELNIKYDPPGEVASTYLQKLVYADKLRR